MAPCTSATISITGSKSSKIDDSYVSNCFDLSCDDEVIHCTHNVEIVAVVTSNYNFVAFSCL